MTFKLGDRVEVIGRKAGGFEVGTIATIHKLNFTTHGGENCHQLVDKDLQNYYSVESDLELLDNEKSIMSNIKEKFALLLKGEPQKSFAKAGVTDSSDMLTEDGKAVFLSWLLKKNGEAFKTEVVDELLKKDTEAATK